MIDYIAIGKALLWVDELPQGAYARYEKDLNSPVIRQREMAKKGKAFRMTAIRIIKQ